ncbi:MAG: hypothetical protein H0X63_11370 [Flavobacteriales bacterium]|nr:hypothetical protein [Flavobacteriales bacterium]
MRTLNVFEIEVNDKIIEQINGEMKFKYQLSNNVDSIKGSVIYNSRTHKPKYFVTKVIDRAKK